MSKKIFYSIFAMVFLLVFVQTSVLSAATAKKAVTFKDTKLESEVRKLLVKKVGVAIYDTECATIKTLKLPKKGIKNISALVWFKGLTNADFSNNALESILVFKNNIYLKNLNIKGMKLKKAELDALIKALPKCTILYDSSMIIKPVATTKPVSTPKPVPTTKPVSAKEKNKQGLFEEQKSANWILDIKLPSTDETKYSVTFDSTGYTGTFSNGTNFSGKFSISDDIVIQPNFAQWKLIGKFDGKAISGKIYKESRYGDMEYGTWSGVKDPSIKYDVRGKWKITYSDIQVNMSSNSVSFDFGKGPNNSAAPSMYAGYTQIMQDAANTSTAYAPYKVQGDDVEWVLYDRVKYTGKFAKDDNKNDVIIGKLYEYQNYWATFKAERIN